MMNEELQNIYLHRSTIPKDTEHFFEEEEEFRRMLMMYNCAIREVSTKLEVLNDDLSITGLRNPIEQIKSRIKQPASIASKLRSKSKPLTIESVKQNLNDVAGIRVIC
ncbi:MAG: GTP pyrophosphokinase family protein, partial [Lachnoclostridium sp.]|nr:GTP pyrophosphokinase family protein [Lachnoclostridium sp.]